MSDSELTPDQQAEIDALTEAWDHDTKRTGVDMSAAMPRLRELFPPEERWISDTEIEVSRTIDVTGIVDTLRHLPDHAGTEAFVIAYNRRPPRAAPPAL